MVTLHMDNDELKWIILPVEANAEDSKDKLKINAPCNLRKNPTKVYVMIIRRSHQLHEEKGSFVEVARKSPRKLLT